MYRVFPIIHTKTSAAACHSCTLKEQDQDKEGLVGKEAAVLLKVQYLQRALKFH